MRLVARSGQINSDDLPRLRKPSMIGQFVLTVLGVQLMFMAAFTSFDLPVATQRNLVNFAENQTRWALKAIPAKFQDKVERYFPLVTEQSRPVRKATYTPVIVAAMFVGYVLGPSLGAIACLGFVVLGVLGPFFGVHPFADGGGVGYYAEPGFGYLLSLVPGAWVMGYLTAKKRTSIKQIGGTVAALTLVHLTGLAYLMGSCLVAFLIDGTRANLAWQPWAFELARNMTWNVLPWDFVFTLGAVGAGFPARWLFKTLTAPDSLPVGNNGRQADLQTALEDSRPPVNTRPVPGIDAAQARRQRSMPVALARSSGYQEIEPALAPAPAPAPINRRPTAFNNMRRTPANVTSTMSGVPIAAMSRATQDKFLERTYPLAMSEDESYGSSSSSSGRRRRNRMHVVDELE